MAEGGGDKASGSTPPVFISYASQDAAVAAALVEALERRGIACWIAPRDVKAGALYADAIVRAISGAKAFVVALSENAIASSHVGKEIERASSKKRPIIAMRMDTAPLTPALEYFLSESQWVKAEAGNMEAAYAKLIDAIREPERTAPGIIPAATLEVSTGTPSTTHLRSRRNGILLAAGLAVVVVALATLLANKVWLAKPVTAEKPAGQVTAAPAAPAISDKSVAVLPFVDMSEKKDQEYFSDGLSEELIDRLTKIPDLRVPARTSSFYFKGKSEDIPTIARRLMVAHVLEGSVRKSGMNLRITAQLVRADNGYHLWSQTYDRKLDDIFKVQDEIAGAVVSALKVSLMDSSALKVPTPKNTEAYTLYLQGRAINRNAGSKAQLDSAAEYMRKAIKADPTFAEAWVWLANVLGNEVIYNYVRADAVAAEMRRATEQALTLDPNLADAHIAKGAIYQNIDWDWEAAVAEFQKAYDLDPTDHNNAMHLGYAQFILHGESDTVLALFQKAIDLDPVNPHCYTATGIYYEGTGKLSEAETAFRKAIDLLPAGPGFHGNLGVVLLVRGKAAAALAEFQRDPDESTQRSGAALAYFALGRRAEADAALAEKERLDSTTDAVSIAEIRAYRGEIDQAFAWLDRAYQQHEVGLFAINRDPLKKSLHGDRRWKAFLRKMKLPE
jgi:TolB-like protein/Flp pilus assembly protein TadD